MECVGGRGRLALLSEGQGKQGWILAMGLENKILPGAAHLQLSLRGCRGGHSQWEQKPSPEPPVCQGGPPGYLLLLLLCQGPTEGGSWERSLILPQSGPGPIRLSVCFFE